MYDHWPGVDDGVIYCKKVDGQTPWEALTAARDRRGGKGARIGSTIWEYVERSWNPPAATYDTFQFLDKNEVVDVELKQGVAAARTNNTNARRMTLLITWFRTATSNNQREVCGFGRNALEKESPTLRKHSLELCLEALRCFKQCDVAACFPTDFETLTCYVDDGLWAALASVGHGMPIKNTATHSMTCFLHVIFIFYGAGRQHSCSQVLGIVG